jgi:prepilin-type processing-associated H-X9-DG protein
LNPRIEARKQMAIEQHLKRANYTFVDGHAAPHVFESTYKLRSINRTGPRLVPEWSHNMYDPMVGY